MHIIHVVDYKKLIFFLFPNPKRQHECCVLHAVDGVSLVAFRLSRNVETALCIDRHRSSIDVRLAAAVVLAYMMIFLYSAVRHIYIYIY